MAGPSRVRVKRKIDLSEAGTPMTEIKQSRSQKVPEGLIGRVKSQPTLFAPEPSRIALRSLSLQQSKKTARFRVTVWRNHALEPLLPAAEPYFEYGPAEIDLIFQDYDDSLSFEAWQTSDLELLWLDPLRYLAKNDPVDWLNWLTSRISRLREVSSAPIVVATWFPLGKAELLRKRCAKLYGVYVADLEKLATEANQPLVDESSAHFSGTPLNPKLYSRIARTLACHWIPGAIFPPLKAVFVDLDNTLYDGVLGEDGPQGVRLTLGHKALQQALLSLKRRGIFLGLISKNRLEDVTGIFQKRKDFPLRIDDFSLVDASWDEKHLAIARGLHELGIGSEAAIFVDDNPGEILSIARALPEVRIIQASEDADLTARAILYTPGLWRWNLEPEDLKRFEDQKANSKRAGLLTESQEVGEYFASLGVCLTFDVNPREKISRLSDLSLKTNQFNLALMRLSHPEIAKYMTPGRVAVGISLEDRLSDSGMIGLVLVRFEASTAFVDEVVISCRALGRQLEDSVVLGAITAALEGEEITDLSFARVQGPRNEPALTWLGKLSPDLRNGRSKISVATIRDFDFPKGIEFSFKGEK